ncbi:Peptidase family U32 [Candidatus Methylomirabilis lanthanidiphila]|uniref:Peptidase family U32 n=1 Tax=Candidatus Methylomirabilis lanthanidiphila TaxID=2211376 RepID=A0A564ZKP6_9BACT|nr:U32 family peptidase [Candidatus Methylomirabilis lanthanidiphila]VUZ85884.1 Peptidase family U32 [Candidatus Methylomirabilis lanthanidiphila]
MFELSTHIPGPKQLHEIDLSAYDALYLGDYTCPLYPGNFSRNIETLAPAVERVKSMGKRCYLSLYAIPKDSDLIWIKELLQGARGLPLDGVEVHNMGLLRTVREILGDIPIHLGVFGNLYTHETARVLKTYGVERVFPNAELSLEELIYIRDHSPVEVIVPLHGKIPLAISGTCFVTDYTGQVPLHCEESCSQGHWLTHEEWELKSIGRANLSGKDLCMLEYLDRLAQSDLNLFYIYTLGETGAYIETAGRVYREALQKVGSNGEVRAAQWLDQLRSVSHSGLCNGFYFGVSGQEYLSPKALSPIA